MYAIIQDGGKQYKVAPGTLVELEKKDFEPGKPLEFSQVIYYHNKNEVMIGTPTLPSIKVKGVVEKHVKGPKIRIFKYKAAKDERRRRGHRQNYTCVRISDIVKE